MSVYSFNVTTNESTLLCWIFNCENC